MGTEDFNLMNKDNFLIFTHYSNLPTFRFVEPINKQIRPEKTQVF